MAHAHPPRLQVPLPPVFLDHPGEPRTRWTNWSAQLDNFFTLTNLTLATDNQLTDRAKNAYLTTLLGSEGLRILMAHPVAATATTADYNTFLNDVRQLFERPINPVRAEFDFRSRQQGACESVSDFLTALRTLYADCTPVTVPDAPAGVATAIEEHNIAMQLAIGCHSRSTQEKLLQESAVSLPNFKRIMEADETAAASSAALRTTQPHVAATTTTTTRHHKPKSQQHRKQPQHHASTSSSSTDKPCCGCGQTGHPYKSSACPAFGKQCRGCGVTHLFLKMCKKERQKLHFLTIGNVHCTKPPPRITTMLEFECNGTCVTAQAMVDTGADISTIQKRTAQSLAATSRIRPTTNVVSNFDGSAIRQVRGLLNTTVKHGGNFTQATLYVVPNDMPAVAGRDLIQALELSIDGHNLQVTGSTSEASTAQRVAIATAPDSLPRSLTDKALGTFPGFEHNITVTKDYTAHVARCRAVPFSKREAVHNEIKAMIDAGIWSPIDKAECAHGLVCVSKKDGGVRITSDLSPLNKYIVPDRHPLPLIEDILLQLHGQQVFSQIDLLKGYYHIVLAEESRPLTATITPLGLMAYNRLPMGLRDAASVFQRCVAQTLTNCKNCVVYIDDILVFGATQQEHDCALEKVLEALASKQFRINESKCMFSTNEITFLGFKVSSAGISPEPDKTAPLQEAPRPTNVRQVMSFLGAVNYLAEFLPRLADMAEPLRLLTRKNEPFRWLDPQERAFQQLKDAISDNITLAIFDPNAPTFVTVDASDCGLGAQLSQLQNGREVPVQFASHTLQDRERNFATNEKEALGCLWAVEHWEKYLLGRHFTIRTDHGSLRTLLTQHTSSRKSAKFGRWLERLSRFDYNIQHIRGEHNYMADALSRLPRPSHKSAITEDEAAELQATIAALQHGPISLESIQ